MTFYAFVDAAYRVPPSGPGAELEGGVNTPGSSHLAPSAGPARVNMHATTYLYAITEVTNTLS